MIINKLNQKHISYKTKKTTLFDEVCKLLSKTSFNALYTNKKISEKPLNDKYQKTADELYRTFVKDLKYNEKWNFTIFQL